MIMNCFELVLPEKKSRFLFRSCKKNLERKSNPNSLFVLISSSPRWHHGYILITSWSTLSAQSSFLNTETILNVFIYCGNLLSFNDPIKSLNSACQSKHICLSFNTYDWIMWICQRCRVIQIQNSGWNESYSHLWNYFLCSNFHAWIFFHVLLSLSKINFRWYLINYFLRTLGYCPRNYYGKYLQSLSA